MIASLKSTTAILGYLALADFTIHLLFANNYGYFRDELYYIISGTQHLSLGYVDFPPFIAYVAALLNLISKDSLISIHIIPALNEGLLVFVSGMISRELGGGRKAQILTAIATLVSLDLLAFGSLLSPDSFDSLWWSLLAYIVIRVIRRKESKLWIMAGLVVGIGMLTKLTIIFFVGALFISMLAFPASRKYLRSKWFVVGGVLAILFVIPMIYWNSVHGWPMIQFYLEFRGDVSGGGPLTFFTTQLLGISLLNVPVFILGLYFYLGAKEGSELRAFGLAYLLLYAFMTILNMKTYYLMPAYPMLFAAGAILIEKSFIARKGSLRWFGSTSYVIALITVASLLAPLAMPILSPPTIINSYGASNYQASPLPDRYGWEYMASNLSEAVDALPPSIKNEACIFTSNYGEASAVNFFGKSLGLPKAISGQNNYYIWGPGLCTGQVLITVGVSLSTIQQVFKNVSTLTTINCQYCISYEQSLPVYLCMNPNFTSLAAEWSGTRDYS
jgi:4-amino-4-deoxy-L-arabinose transferase-like glycosyltransferase